MSEGCLLEPEQEGKYRVSCTHSTAITYYSPSKHDSIENHSQGSGDCGEHPKVQFLEPGAR